MDKLRSQLNALGLVRLDDLFERSELATLNAALDPHFAALAHEPRSYAYSVDLNRLGRLDAVLGERTLKVLFDVMPDPVIYHLHAYEIAARNPSPHIFGHELAGWHRDPDSAWEPAAPTHVSLFVYLTDVAETDGPFEFLPGRPQGRFSNGAASVSLTGAAGTSFLWNRAFFHRASPNRGEVRRRLLKISIQKNRYESSHLAAPHLAPVAAAERGRDPHRALLFGAWQGRQAPELDPPATAWDPGYRPVAPNRTAEVDALTRLKSAMKSMVGVRAADAGAAAYD